MILHRDSVCQQSIDYAFRINLLEEQALKI